MDTTPRDCIIIKSNCQVNASAVKCLCLCDGDAIVAVVKVDVNVNAVVRSDDRLQPKQHNTTHTGLSGQVNEVYDRQHPIGSDRTKCDRIGPNRIKSEDNTSVRRR